MSRQHATLPRLHVDAHLSERHAVALTREQSAYLLQVLRRDEGDRVLVFNGRDGEWLCEVRRSGKREAGLQCMHRTREQTPAPKLIYLFAPLKAARLDYMAQKAVEMGAGTLRPVLTQRTQVSRIKSERLAANAIEAAEQCGLLSLPSILPEARLEQALAELDAGIRLIFCDEEAPLADALVALSGLRGQRFAVLIGPEGGFDDAERALILRRPGTVRLSLGPRILRADTAAVAALAVIQAACGDWM
jgi:16S rRNA (uracil1498-N3)-methyltransferase